MNSTIAVTAAATVAATATKNRVIELIHGTRTTTIKDTHGIICFYGSWNVLRQSHHDTLRTSLRGSQFESIDFIQVDHDDEFMDYFLGDNKTNQSQSLGLCPPQELPALLIFARRQSRCRMDFIRDIKSRNIFKSGKAQTIQTSANTVLQSLLEVKRTTNEHEQAIRIFVAGDRSSVGKSSVCLGLLGTLLTKGYKPSELAYIKPATQCEAPQLVQAYCDKIGISCVPVGPIVYFKGFTRAFLALETESTEELLSLAKNAVHDIARGKKIILIDGVGFPAVGSVCGTDNAAVARACGYQDGTPPGVLLVSPSGVGNAVDSFNLNATFFMAQNVPVLGTVFNKLSLDGFYSLESCREIVTSYFDQYQPDKKAFGFIPVYPQIASDHAIEHVDDFIQIFAEHVDVDAIVAAALKIKGSSERALLVHEKPKKKQKTVIANGLLSRAQIEEQALVAGAAPSA